MLPFIGYIEPWHPAHQNNASIGRIRTNASGFHHPEAFITLIRLDRAGLTPQLPWIGAPGTTDTAERHDDVIREAYAGTDRRVGFVLNPGSRRFNEFGHTVQLDSIPPGRVSRGVGLVRPNDFYNSTCRPT